MKTTKSGLSLDLSIPDISFHDLFISWIFQFSSKNMLIPAEAEAEAEECFASSEC